MLSLAGYSNPTATTQHLVTMRAKSFLTALWVGCVIFDTAACQRRHETNKHLGKLLPSSVTYHTKTCVSISIRPERDCPLSGGYVDEQSEKNGMGRTPRCINPDLQQADLLLTASTSPMETPFFSPGWAGMGTRDSKATGCEGRMKGGVAQGHRLP